MTDTRTVPTPKVHPAFFAVLIIPFGAAVGFASVALGFMATRNGLSITQGAQLTATAMLPNVWKFFFAPVTDMTMTRKRWYALSTLVVAAGMAASAILPLNPQTFWLINLLVLLTSVAACFTGFAVEGMLAHYTDDSNRGMASGWFQAGNLGGSGLGGFLGLWLLEHCGNGWTSGLILGGSMLLGFVVLPWIPDIPAHKALGGVKAATRSLAVDLWQTLRTRRGTLAAILSFIPLGTGAAASVLSQAEVAAHWNAGPDEVALTQGLLAGIVSMFGCMLGGWGCNRLGARLAYIVYGALMGLETLAMAFLPATVSIYIGCSMLYSFITGMCYAAFSAYTLEAIGEGNAATKYNGFASLSNFPIWYMGLLLAAIVASHGTSAMFYTEALCSVIGIGIFVAGSLLLRNTDAAKAKVAA